MLQNVAEALWVVVERYGTLRSIAWHYGMLWKRCGSLWTLTENIDFAHHKLNFKFCSSLKCWHACSSLHFAAEC